MSACSLLVGVVVVTVLNLGAWTVNGKSVHGKCGATMFPRRGRIISGKNSYEGEFPWMVSFKSATKGNHFCAGFVISERHAISAAHCFFSTEKSMSSFLSYLPDGKVNYSSVSAAVGEYSLISEEQIAKEVRIPVEEITVHPTYSASETDADIAVIRLGKSVFEEHSLMTPICLPSKEVVTLIPEKAPQLQCTAVGWGLTNYTHDYELWAKSMDILQKAQVDLWTPEKCKQKYEGYHGFPSDAFLCAGGNVQPNGETCKGDSGGPLMTLSQNKWTAIGIVSVGKDCAKNGHPTVYTDLSHFLPWIKQLIQSH